MAGGCTEVLVHHDGARGLPDILLRLVCNALKQGKLSLSIPHGFPTIQTLCLPKPRAQEEYPGYNISDQECQSVRMTVWGCPDVSFILRGQEAVRDIPTPCYTVALWQRNACTQGSHIDIFSSGRRVG